MKGLKRAITVVLCLILLAAEGVLLGLFMADTALSEKSIEKSMTKSDMIAQLVEEAIAENTVNMGSVYGDFAKDVFCTEPMENFFVDYLTAAVNTEIYGRAYNEIAYDELTSALVQGAEEVTASGKYDLSSIEVDMIIQAIKEEVPTLTAAMDEQVNRYEAISGELTEDVFQQEEFIKTLLGPGVKTIVIVLCILLFVGIIVFCQEGRLGLLWCAVTSLAAAAAYGYIYLVGADALIGDADISPSEEMIVRMLSGGASNAALAGLLLTVVFTAVFIIMRLIDRRKASEQTFETAECAVEGDR